MTGCPPTVVPVPRHTPRPKLSGRSTVQSSCLAALEYMSGTWQVSQLKHRQVAVLVGQPVVGGLGAVAGIATAHRAGLLRRHLIGEARAARQIVQRLVQVLAQLEPARIKRQVLRPGALGLLEVHRVVERVVTVGALHPALGVNIPGPCQILLAHQVHARIGQALGGDDLAGGHGAPDRRVTADGHDGIITFVMHQAVAQAAVLIDRVLDRQLRRRHGPVFGEGVGVPAVGVAAAFDQTGRKQRGGVGPAESALLQTL